MSSGAFEHPLLLGSGPRPAEPADPGVLRALLDPQGSAFAVMLALAATVALVVLAGAVVRAVGA